MNNSGSSAEFTRFLGYAQRSCAEVQSEDYVALDQNYITEKQFNEIYDLGAKTSSKIGAFIKYLKQQKTKNQEPRTENREPCAM
ncbi:MAG: four helix bundle protein, partial [Thermodesulfobacteriota bacterium]